MAIATILLHLGHDAPRRARLQVAVDLARRFDSFLEVLHLGVPDERTAVIEDDVRRVCSDCSYSWTVAEGDPMEMLTRQAGFADLAVLGQSGPVPFEDAASAYLADRLPLHVACPVLIVPREAEGAAPGQHLLLAWKNCREAGRAVRDSLPFLQAADRVTVLSVGVDSSDESDLTHLSVYLARHGVETECHPESWSDAEAGEAILAVAREVECDGIVMGAYGHSRLRDKVLGSATHTVLRQMHVPVLMSH
ncbi:MAG: universal stress protein [Rhodospirillaceae bacterium]